MKNRLLVGVDFYHSYFKDSFFNGVSVEPLAETQRILRNHRAGIKYYHNGFRLFIATDDHNNPFIDLPAGTRLYFRLRLNAPDWPLFSEHFHLPPPGYCLFTNAGNPAEDAELSVKALDKPVPGDQFGLLEIEIAEAMIVASEPPVLKLSFSARSALWEFFLVTDLSDNPNAFSIVDVEPQRSENPIVFRAVAVDETAAMPMQQRLKNRLLARHPDAICVHYVSEQQIACRQQGVANIRLLHNASRLLDNLPNPSLKNISRFIPREGDMGQPQDAFFQVVKYITHSFSTNGT